MSKVSVMKGSATTRFPVMAMAMLALPLFATAQHRGGGGASAPAAASRPAPMVSRAASPTVHASGRPVTRAQSAPRFGAPMARTRNGVHINRRNNNLTTEILPPTGQTSRMCPAWDLTIRTWPPSPAIAVRTTADLQEDLVDFPLDSAAFF